MSDTAFQPFLDKIREARDFILDETKKDSRFLIVTHFDADGLSAGAIIAKTLVRLGSTFQLRTAKQLDEDIVKKALEIGPDAIIFSEIGSGYIDIVNKHVTKLKCLVREDFFHAGTYLGKVKNSVFFPSFPLLTMIAEKETSNKVIVDENTEWLFICGRDIFRKGILKTEGVKRKGDHALILNKHGECLGFGRLVLDLNKKVAGQQVAMKNISDLGDFLRREKTISR